MSYRFPARPALAIGAGAMLALGACRQPAATRETSGALAPAQPSPAAQSLTDAQKQALLAELPPAYRGADLANGEAKFAICRSCHSIDQGGEDMTGPNLWGVFGRKAGSKPGFSYSDGLRAAGWRWDAARIDTWIENPRAVIADTKMTFIGMPSATDRRDVVAYLKVMTSPAPKA